MKKFALLFVAFALTLALAGCGNNLPDIPDEVDMENIDEYLGRSDVQYVDLRNFDDKMNAGYIAGFEFIPFFDYLEYEGILVRDGDWEFEADEILSESGLTALFDMDKTIFLMCGSGTRAGYVMAALEELGYENVYNVGGIADYTGDNKVLGDGSYTLNPLVKGDYTPGTYFGLDEDSGYMATVVINEKGGIEEVILDALYEKDPDRDPETDNSYWTTKQALGEGYDMDTSPDGENFWFTQANTLAEAILDNQGWDDAWAITDGHFDDFAGVTVSIDGLKLAFEEAIGQAE